MTSRKSPPQADNNPPESSPQPTPESSPSAAEGSASSAADPGTDRLREIAAEGDAGAPADGAAADPAGGWVERAVEPRHYDMARRYVDGTLAMLETFLPVKYGNDTRQRGYAAFAPVVAQHEEDIPELMRKATLYGAAAVWTGALVKNTVVEVKKVNALEAEIARLTEAHQKRGTDPGEARRLALSELGLGPDGQPKPPQHHPA